MSDRSRLVTLDGSRGEGGGQILRTALSLSLLTGRPFRITRIRANRTQPGLRPQHVTAVEAAARLGNAEVSGAAVGARELTFRPARYVPRDLTFDIGTAGATALVLQTLALPLAMRADGPVRLNLLGGTFNTRAPSFPFLATTWRDYFEALGLKVSVAMHRAGFYPRGGGHLEAWIEPGTPRPLTLIDRPPLEKVVGVAGIANLHGRSIAERLREHARLRLRERGIDAAIELADWPSPGQGAAIGLTARHGTIGTTTVGLGERGKPSEIVAEEAVDELMAFESAAGAVDPHSADQLVLPLALAEGASVYTVTAVTDHLRTNIDTVRAFLDRPIRLEEFPDAPARVVIA